MMKKLKTFENFKLNELVHGDSPLSYDVDREFDAMDRGEISPEELEDFLLDAKSRLDSDFENVTSDIGKFVENHPEVKKDEILSKIWWSFVKEWSLTAKKLGL